MSFVINIKVLRDNISVDLAYKIGNIFVCINIEA